VTQHNAGNIVKALAPIVGGSGVGRPDMAQAGGRDITKIDVALNEARVLLQL
jgi:alanyl-tRNA synthetase